MSTGRRIAREIKNALLSNSLPLVLDDTSLLLSACSAAVATAAILLALPLGARAAVETDPQALYATMRRAYEQGQAHQGWRFVDEQLYLSSDPRRRARLRAVSPERRRVRQPRRADGDDRDAVALRSARQQRRGRVVRSRGGKVDDRARRRRAGGSGASAALATAGGGPRPWPARGGCRDGRPGRRCGLSARRRRARAGGGRRHPRLQRSPTTRPIGACC